MSYFIYTDLISSLLDQRLVDLRWRIRRIECTKSGFLFSIKMYHYQNYKQ